MQNEHVVNVLVTAGPTREFLDPVRFLSNRSSGRMGFAVAEQAVRRGHRVRLIAGPVALPVPDGVEVRRVTTAEEMLTAVRADLSWCQALIMAAAVADLRPAVVSGQKIKKQSASLDLKLERTADILDAIRASKGNRVFVGFAAETDNLEAEATRKLGSKGLDLIVANDVSRPDAGFEVGTNKVLLLAANGARADLPVLPKAEVASRLLDWIEEYAEPGLRAGNAQS